MHVGLTVFVTLFAMLLLYYLLDYLEVFYIKKKASARHILNQDAAFLTQLKEELSNSKNVLESFATAATEYSSCPSGSRAGGSLGSFNQGSMVPAFDKVVFSEEVGKIHGPIATQFGYHLIYIESRSGDEEPAVIPAAIGESATNNEL